MNDLISRQAAIDAMSVLNDSICEQQAIDALCELPSAEPKRGRWVIRTPQSDKQTFDECECSECGAVEYFNVGWHKFNYCPNCGAKMGADDAVADLPIEAYTDKNWRSDE